MNRWGRSSTPRGVWTPIAALGALAMLAPACGGGENEARKPTPSVTPKHAAQDADIMVGSSSSVLLGGSEESKPVLVPNLPGLTVVGRGEAKGTSDGAILRFTIGPGDQFPGPGGVALESIEEAELDPVVQALRDAGAPANTLTVNTYAVSPYTGFGGAAQITLTWPRPREIKRAVEAVQNVVREQTRYSVQNVETLFTTLNCTSLEDQAWKQALEEARRRAGRLARVGPVISVSESGGAPSPYFGSSFEGCQALRSLPPSFLDRQLPKGPACGEGGGHASGHVRVRRRLRASASHQGART